jgi:signal transduction histidine kinase
MDYDGQETLFLPAPLAAAQTVRRQHGALAGHPTLRTALDASLSLTLVLNAQRQIVYVNEALRERLGLADGEVVIGSRYGDCFDCVNASVGPNGCGTTAACRDCGLAQAVAAAQVGRATRKTCRVRTTLCGQDLSLFTQASPLSFGGETFTIVSATDIEDQLRRRELERIFFHDVLNTAGGVQGLLHVMQESDHEKDLKRYLPIATRASDDLIDELLSQRDLAAAENGELEVTLSEVRTGELLAHLSALFAAHPLAGGRSVTLTPDIEDLVLKTDKVLLSRVLVNLIKNALEAVPKGGVVTVDCRREGDRAVFTVHNPTAMPTTVQNQVFQRSFSTKGAGRGLGTFSIRLLTENYLGGKVGFVSAPATGTVFRAAFPMTN